MLAMTGGSGKLGRAVAAELLRRGPAASIRLGTRSPEVLAPLGATGARIMQADFDDPSSLRRLFEGCEVALIISGDAPNAERIAQHAAAFDAARSAGVGRIVYTSFVNAVPESRFLVAPSHAESERMLRSLGPAFTILRNTLYAENIMVETARATGELVQPGSAGRVAYITYADVARATAGAVTGTGHENRIYEITGPEAVDQFEIAERLTAALRRPVRVRDISTDAYAASLAQRGLPPFIVDLLCSLRRAIGDNEYAAVSPDAARLAGGPIRPVGEFLAEA